MYPSRAVVRGMYIKGLGNVNHSYPTSERSPNYRSWVHNLLTASARLRGVNGRPYLAVVMTCGMSLQPYMEDNKLRSRCLWTKLLPRERWCKFMSNNLLTFHLRVGLATINSIARLVDRALDSPSILRFFCGDKLYNNIAFSCV